MKNLVQGSTFEKTRRWALVASVSAILLLGVLMILEAWGAIEFQDTSGGGWDYFATSTFWGKLQDSLSIVAGFAFMIIVLVLFIIPRKKD